MYLIAEVLDKQLVDRAGENAGRVDGIVLVLRQGKPPVVADFVVSPITLFARLNERFAAWYAKVDRRFGPERGKPFRIPRTRVTRYGTTLELDFDVEQSPINALEDYLRVHVVERLPGA
jgi:sporulation protein YlmC with PRC-barrel domain